jgi:antitoxin ParD1/3/4
MTTKLTISVPDELAAEARDAVRAGKAASVSGYIAAAIECYRKAQVLDEFFAEMYAEVGPPSAEDYARARAELGLEVEHAKSA